MVEHISGKVYLTPHAGTTSVNTDIVTSKIKLTHGNIHNFITHKLTVLLCTGDIVQCGSTTVFRFNHPEEAAEMKEKDEVCTIRAFTCANIKQQAQPLCSDLYVLSADTSTVTHSLPRDCFIIFILSRPVVEDGYWNYHHFHQST